MRMEWTPSHHLTSGRRDCGMTPLVLWRVGPEMKFEGGLQGREIPCRPARTDVTYDVRVDCEDGAFEAQIINLSAMGFRLRCEAAIEVGSRVSLTVGKFPPVGAVIRWVRGDECGGAFVEPVIL
jgi:hypothetical protein